jgi:hypothetical protein
MPLLRRSSRASRKDSRHHLTYLVPIARHLLQVNRSGGDFAFAAEERG